MRGRFARMLACGFAGPTVSLYFLFIPENKASSTEVVPVTAGHRDELEARVARLERLLDRVLELVQELKADSGSQPPPTPEEVPWALIQADWATSPETGESDSPGAPEAEVSAEIDVIETGEEEAEEEVPEAAPAGSEGKPEDRPPEWYHPREKAGAPATGAGSTRAGPERPAPAHARGMTDILSDLGIWPLTEVFLSRLGIGILLLAVAYFFKYSIDQGWLIPAVRLAIGLGAGIALVVMGFKGASKGEPLGTALAGGGIATFFITGYTGHQWYSVVSYPAAFGFLFAASALGIFLSLRSGLQTLAIVGLIGALATPLLLSSPNAEVAGLALYVSLIVASVAAIYMARAWRAVLILAALTGFAVLSLAVFSLVVSGFGQTPPTSAWVVQGAIAFCALTFWLVPLLRAELRAGSPGKWLRPETAYPAEDESTEDGVTPSPARGFWFGERSAVGTAYVPWNAHLDALSLLMPVVAITLSMWLWDLSGILLGWVFLGSALLAQGVGMWISRSHDPEDSASTQWFVAILLSTVGLGLVFKDDILYLALIAEAVALMTVGARKGSQVVLAMGWALEFVVLVLFISRLPADRFLLEGNLSSVFDLVAIGGAAFIGTQLKNKRAQLGLFVGAYLAFLVFTARELNDHLTVLYLVFLVEALGTHILAARRNSRVLEGLGHVALALVFVFFVIGIQSGRTLMGGDLAVLVDVAALLGAVYLGTLVSSPESRQALFAGAYLGFLAILGRELADHLSALYLVFVFAAVITQVVSVWRKNSLLALLGHVPAFLALAFFANGMETGRNLFTGDLTSFVDLAALGGAAYIATLMTGRQGRLVYLFAAYVGLLLWTGRELYPLDQGQAFMSLAFGLEGAAVLVAGFLMDRPLLQKVGMATLLMVVVKVLLVDLAAVEPIWRVLLLFIFGGLFLVLSKFIKGRTSAHE